MTGKTNKIFNEKLNYKENATSKIKSLENIDYKPKSSEFQIFNDHLPWLRYNRPNLSEEIKSQIEKKFALDKTTKVIDKLSNSDSFNTKKTSETSPKFGRRKINSLSELHTEAINNSKEVNTLDSKTSNSSLSSNYHKNSRKYISNENSKITENIYKNEKVDASTETEKINQVSIEIQTNFNNSTKGNKPKKLRQTMTNSITIPENVDKKYSTNLRYQTKELKYGKLKKKSESKPIRKNELITTELIDVFLPSITNRADELCGKKYSTYSFPNTYSKNLTERSAVSNLPHKLAVTHAGVDFLDKYWAVQRQMLINKENFHSRNDFISENSDNSLDESMTKFPYSYASSELPVFQEVWNNKNATNLNHTLKTNTRLSNEKLKKVTSLELDNILV